MKIATVPIGDLVPWPKNPRGIKKKDFERLKKQIKKLGNYKPLICYRDGKKLVVLGGNMRLRALQELHFKEIEVSVVEAKTEARKIEYSISDNDRAGHYEELALAELIFPEMGNIVLEDFKVDLGSAVDLKAIIEGVGPDLDSGQGILTEKETENECPKCGHRW